MKTSQTVLLGLICIAWCGVVDAGPIPTGSVYTNKSRFRIPFRYDPAEMQSLGAREIRLFVSRDHGASYQQAQSVSPQSGKFNFQAPSDGEYWFVVKTVDSRNRLHPDGEVMDPGLKVVVDTVPPQLRLEVRQTTPGRAQLVWNAGDEHLDPTQLKLEYIQPGTSNWQTVSVVPRAAGETEWSVPQGGIVSVRGTISDLAKNMASDQNQVRIAPVDQTVPRPSVPDFRQPIASPGIPGNNGLAMSEQFPRQNGFNSNSNGNFDSNPVNSASQGFSPAPAGQPAMAQSGLDGMAAIRENGQFAPIRSSDFPSAATVNPTYPKSSFISHRAGGSLPDPNEGSEAAGAVAKQISVGRFRVVNTRQFQIGYKLQDVGPSGVSSVELFITQDDGATWYKYGDDPDNTSPMQVDVPKEGTYGFAIGVRSGVGIASDPPQPGEKPAIVVVVDQTPPQLEFLPIEQGRGRAINKILIQWRYQDEHPAEKPISLSYSPNPQGPWQSITGWQENTGSYVWTIGPGMPSKFYLRLEGRDVAGNVEGVDTPQPLLIDLSRPTAKIIEIESGNGTVGPQ